VPATPDRTSDTVASPLQGKSVLEGQPGWDEARQAWQLRVDQRPAAVVFSESAQDVVSAVRFAHERGLRVTAQGRATTPRRWARCTTRCCSGPSGCAA
jgi:hypothetical protein